MRAETAAYRSERLKYVTSPNLWVRFFHVPAADSAQEYAFKNDFGLNPVVGAVVPKLLCVRRIAGNTQTVDPIAGSSSIGTLTIELTNVGRALTRQVADPALPLHYIAGTDCVVLGDGTGYPLAGHLIIDQEDIAYSSYSFEGVVTIFTVATRGARGTTQAAHSAGALVHNGEQIRRAQRLTLFLGYAPLDEDDYGPGPGYVRMAVQAVSSPDNGLTWVIQAADIQRFIEQTLFSSSREDAPAVLGPGHPLTLALQVLHSTGQGNNGPYDVLPRDQGAAVPQHFVATEIFEFIRDTVLPGLQMQFREMDSDNAKAFVEQQILRPLNLVPLVTQRGRYSARSIRQPGYGRGGVLAHAFIGSIAGGVAFQADTFQTDAFQVS